MSLIAVAPTLSAQNLTIDLPVEIPTGPVVPQMIWTSAAPDRPGHILLCTFGWNAAERRAGLDAYLSSDGGMTWEHVLRDATSSWVSEVSCTVGPDGAAYVVAGVSKRTGITRGHPYGVMHVWRSHDGGRTWTGPTTGPFMDWTATAVDATSGRRRGQLYVFGHDIADGEGSWTGPAKPLRVSTDGGMSFSQPMFNGIWPESGGGYPLGARVLHDGSVVAMYREEYPAAAYTIVTSSDGGQSLTRLPRIPQDSTITRQNSLSAGFAVDQSGGNYNGRFYLAYPAVRAGQKVIMLARSNDGGETWQNSVATKFLSDSTAGSLGFAGLAVNRYGVVGLTWYEPDQACQRFAASFDGGESFDSITSLSSCTPTLPSGLQPLEYHLQTMGTYEPDAPPGVPPGAVATGQGLSIRLSRMDLGSAQLTADASGVFHPVWMEQRPDGRLVLMTTRVMVGSNQASQIPKNVNGLTEITERMIVDVQSQQFDSNSGTYLLNFTLTNISDSIFVGPLRLRLSEVTSGVDFGDATVLDTDNSINGVGAVFDLTEVMDEGRLLPGMATQPYRIGFQVRPLITPDALWEKLNTGVVIHPVSTRFQIYVESADLIK